MGHPLGVVSDSLPVQITSRKSLTGPVPLVWSVRRKMMLGAMLSNQTLTLPLTKHSGLCNLLQLPASIERALIDVFPFPNTETEWEWEARGCVAMGWDAKVSFSSINDRVLTSDTYCYVSDSMWKFLENLDGRISIVFSIVSILVVTNPTMPWN